MFTCVVPWQWFKCERFARAGSACSGFGAFLRVNSAAKELGDKVVVKAEGMEVGAAKDVGSCEHGWVLEKWCAFDNMCLFHSTWWDVGGTQNR